MRTGKWKREITGTKYMAANCEESQNPPRAVELRRRRRRRRRRANINISIPFSFLMSGGW
jgi:hypothetical protein